jgi:predicted DNA binding CopG/RHH family protein
MSELFTIRPSAVAVSFRVAPDLLRRVKRQAARAGVPYQTFMKGASLRRGSPSSSAEALG